MIIQFKIKGKTKTWKETHNLNKNSEKMLPEYCTTLVKNCKYVQFTNIYKIFFVGFKELPFGNNFL